MEYLRKTKELSEVLEPESLGHRTEDAKYLDFHPL